MPLDTDAERILARYERMFGAQWRRPVGRAIDLDANLISRGRPPTMRLLLLTIEWLECTDPVLWPERYSELAEMAANR